MSLLQGGESFFSLKEEKKKHTHICTLKYSAYVKSSPCRHSPFAEYITRTSIPSASTPEQSFGRKLELAQQKVPKEFYFCRLCTPSADPPCHPARVPYCNLSKCPCLWPAFCLVFPRIVPPQWQWVCEQKQVPQFTTRFLFLWFMN